MWALLFGRGIAALLFAAINIVAPAVPSLDTMSLVRIFGAYTAVDGILALALAHRASRTQERWIALAIVGCLDLATGGISLVRAHDAPDLLNASIGLYGSIAIWALPVGIVELFGGMRAAGLLTLLFGILIAVTPVLATSPHFENLMFFFMSSPTAIWIFAGLLGIAFSVTGLRLRTTE